MKKRMLLIAAALVAAALLGIAVQQVSRSRTFQFFGGLVDRVETEEKAVALTFDDGPTGRTDEILAILEDADIKATFFLCGGSIGEFPGETERIVRAGHQVGNHTYSHRRMVFLTPAAIAGEIERTDGLIRSAGYEGDIPFRPPYGKKLLLLPYYLHRHGRTTVMWDLEPNTIPEVNAGAENIARYVVDNARPGSIILLHVMYDAEGNSIGAIKGIAEGLKAEGYRFVTVSELINMGKTQQ